MRYPEGVPYNGIAIALAVAVLPVLLPLPSAMAAPEISLSPSEGRQGDIVQVTGSGFAKISPIVITFDGEIVERTVSVKGEIYKDFRVRPSQHGEVTVTAADKEGNSASAIFTVINEVPTAENTQVSVNEDDRVSITLSARDANSDALTYAISKEPSSGTLAGFNAESGTVTYAPGPNFSGNDSFEFFASDGLDESARAVVSITVAPVNDSPTVQSSNASVDENSNVGITLQGSDPDGDELTFSISDGPDHGTLSGTSPHLTYAPAPGYAGSDSFGFVAFDGSQYSGTGTVSVTVLAVNSPPSAASMEVETEEDEEVTIRLSAMDPDSDDVSFDIESAPSHGSLGSIEKTGPLTAEVAYRPSHNYHGTDVFTFTVNDGEFESDAATVEIDIEPVNDAPEATSQSVTVQAGERVEITLSGEDAENEELDFLVVQGTSRGTLGSISSDDDSAVVTYTPDPDEDGQDSFTFRVSDGDLESNIATVTVAIEAQETAEETAQAQDQIVTEDSVTSDTQLGEDIEEAALPPSPSPTSPAADSETPIEVPLPQARPDDVAQGAAMKSLSTASVESTSASSSTVWLIPAVLVGIASLVALLAYREKNLARGALFIPEKLLGLMARAGLVASETANMRLGRSAGQPAFSGPMNRIYRILNDEKCRTARKHIFDVSYSGIRADPTQYEASKALAKKQFEQIGSILQSNPELQEPYFESFGEITLKVWWAIKEDVGLDGRKGMRRESLEWLGSETEKYWARQSRGSKAL